MQKNKNNQNERKIKVFEIDCPHFKQKLYHWALNYDYFLILDSQHYNSKYEFLAGIGAVQVFQPQNNFFDEFQNWIETTNDWVFGHFSYDLKNYIEKLESKHPDFIGFPELLFFQPEIVIKIKQNKVEYLFFPQIPIEKINKTHYTILNYHISDEVFFMPFKKRISKDEYFENFQKIRHHIQLGDIYEINYCQEFYNETFNANPASAFQKLMKYNATPFSAFYRNNHRFLLCASPERYLKKEGTTIISQPMKGTIRKDKKNLDLKTKLEQSAKDIAENVMIVDLVRNDLSRTAIKNSVKVVEMCQVYEFPSVYQMISTITSQVSPHTKIAEIIQTTFPMGSMTGAPKVKAMELIEKYEKTKRGLYSGSVGYISPESDFDFNVVIRSLQINQKTHYASFLTGGAITIQSKAEDEYQECFTKADGLLNAFNTYIE